MRHGISVVFCWLAIAGWPSRANAQDEPRQWGRFDSVHIDQDLFAPGNEDRNYTMGLRFNWQGREADRQLLNMFDALRAMDRTFGLTYGDYGFNTVSLGNSAFTPDDLRRDDPIRDDRPYSSILYTSSSVVIPGPDDHAVESKLVVGVLGLRVSEWVQTEIHSINRSMTGDDEPYAPKGWGNQISDGGEPTAMYQRSWMRRFPIASEAFDAAGSCEMYVGYYTGGSCGAVWKVGRFDKQSAPFWSMLGEINPQADASGFLGAAPASATGAAGPWIKEWYLLLGVRARIVGYNELLQGGFRNSEHVVRSTEIERLLGEASVGFNLTFSSGRRLMLTCTQRSPEHKLGQRRSHRWCGINYFRSWR